VHPVSEPPAFEDLPSGSSFPQAPAEFLHDLDRDGRLTLEAIADLADRLPRQSTIDDTAAQPLLVPQGGPPRGRLPRPGDVIRNLDRAGAWLTLLNVDDDPEYARLMNTMLDRLEQGMFARPGTLRNRRAFIFVSSPNSVTPAHFDIEHSLLMQVSGSKTVTIGGFPDESARRLEVDRYWDGSHGRVETMPEALGTCTLTPGRGVYLPPVVPHWVHNGPQISISMTLTYFTAATVRENRVEDFNSLLRRWRMHPRPPGRSAGVDSIKVAAMGGWSVARRLQSMLGRGARSGDGSASAASAASFDRS
jgi:hypothetical protein